MEVEVSSVSGSCRSSGCGGAGWVLFFLWLGSGAGSRVVLVSQGRGYVILERCALAMTKASSGKRRSLQS